MRSLNLFGIALVHLSALNSFFGGGDGSYNNKVSSDPMQMLPNAHVSVIVCCRVGLDQKAPYLDQFC